MSLHAEPSPEALQRRHAQRRNSTVSSMPKVITANTASATAIPVPDVDASTPSMDFGDGNDFGRGWGEDADVGGGFANLPASIKKRCSKTDRLGRFLPGTGAHSK